MPKEATLPTLKKVPSIPVEDLTAELQGKDIEARKLVYMPDWGNKPEPVKPVLSQGGTPILTHQNIAALIALPGQGKSSWIEAIMAKKLNPEVDAMGAEVDPSCTGMIYIDNERTNTDVWNSFFRMAKRAKLTYGQPISGVTIAGMRQVARLDQRRNIIEDLLSSNPCSLLLLDGAGDMVRDTNDLQEALDCRMWMREISVKFDTSILVTLHPNPNSARPRGHQGSEICREAETVLLIKSHDAIHKIITSDFEAGKNRNNPKLTTAFKWSDEQGMFISADYDDLIIGGTEAAANGKRVQSEALARSVLPVQTSLRHVELVNAIMQTTEQSEITAKRKIKDMEKLGIIQKFEDGLYRIKK